MDTPICTPNIWQDSQKAGVCRDLIITLTLLIVVGSESPGGAREGLKYIKRDGELRTMGMMYEREQG